jgi:hypothetical protein
MPDETLYSALCRYKKRYNFPDNLFASLLGPFSKRSPLYPLPINNLITRVPCSKSAQDILEDNSILPLLRPALAPPERDLLEARLLNGNMAAHLKQFTKDDRYVRICPVCARADKKTMHGVYLRRLHQLRFALVCPLHQTKLHFIEVKLQNKKELPFLDLSLLPTKTLGATHDFLLAAKLLNQSYQKIRHQRLSEVILGLQQAVEERYGNFSLHAVTPSLSEEIKEFCMIANLPAFRFFPDIAGSKVWSKRSTTRLLRMVIFFALCADDQLVVKRYVRKLKPKDQPRKYPCKNPSVKCSGFGKSIGVLVTYQWKHRIECQVCGFTYGARVNSRGEIRRVKFISAGPELLTKVAELWPGHTWQHIMRTTKLTRSQLALTALDIGLSVQEKNLASESQVKLWNQKRLGGAGTERMKTILLGFFREHPKISAQEELKEHGLYKLFRLLRRSSPQWIFENTPPALRLTLRPPAGN